MAATNLSVYGPAPVDKDGVLAAFVQQPVANTPSEISKFRIVYTEKLAVLFYQKHYLRLFFLK